MVRDEEIVGEDPCRHDRPRCPGIGVAHRRKRDDWPAIEAEWAPARVAGRAAPGDPGRRPAPIGHPVPPIGGEPPAAVVMRRPRPAIGADPEPAEVAVGRPAPDRVRTPSDAHAGIPGVAAVVRQVVPRTVAVESAAVDAQVGRQILRRRRAEALGAHRGDPAVEAVAKRGVDAVGRRRRAPLVSDALGAGADDGASERIDQVGLSAEHGHLQLGRSAPRAQRKTVVARCAHQDRTGGRVDAVVERLGGAGEREPDAPIVQSNERLRQQVHPRELVDIERRAVLEQDLRAPALGPKDVACH